MSPHIIRQVTRELTDLQKNPPEGIKVIVNEEDVTDVQATIDGPGKILSIIVHVLMTLPGLQQLDTV